MTRRRIGGARPPGKTLVPLMVRREARKDMPANMAALKQKMETG